MEQLLDIFINKPKKAIEMMNRDVLLSNFIIHHVSHDKIPAHIKKVCMQILYANVCY